MGSIVIILAVLSYIISEHITTEPTDEEPTRTLTGTSPGVIDEDEEPTSPGVYIGAAFAVAAMLVVMLAVALVIWVYFRRRRRVKTVLNISGSEVIAR